MTETEALELLRKLLDTAEACNSSLDYVSNQQQPWEDSPPAPEIFAEVRAFLASPGKVDDPVFDATDFAHPAWWRGQDYGCEATCREVNAIIDGKEPTGTSREPWEQTRKRLWSLVGRASAQTEPPDGQPDFTAATSVATPQDAPVLGVRASTELCEDEGCPHFGTDHAHATASSYSDDEVEAMGRAAMRSFNPNLKLVPDLEVELTAEWIAAMRAALATLQPKSPKETP
jgi:hypothetical protein